MTSQSAAQTGGHNGIQFRVSPDGRRFDFVGLTNLSSRRCLDTLSDRTNAQRGFGHQAPPAAINGNGKFFGKGSSRGVSTLIVGRFEGNGHRATGIIDDGAGQCHIRVTFAVRAR